MNISKLNKIISEYKLDFNNGHWEDEKYKWQAIKWFNEQWDIESDNFAEMLENAISKTYNLLASGRNFPARMIVGFAKEFPEEVRSMFRELFDETTDVVKRIQTFKQKSAILLEKYSIPAKQHFQGENAVSTYLWLRYPDKYYIYKIGAIKVVSDILDSGYVFINGRYEDNLRNFYSFYDEICIELQKNEDIKQLLASNLSNDCHSDLMLKTLTVDIGYYISQKYGNVDIDDSDEFWPSLEQYSPHLAVEDWTKLLNNDSIFDKNSLLVINHIYDNGGQATCKELSEKYGKSYGFYNTVATKLAKRVHKETKCPLYKRDNGEECWWTILFTGMQAGKEHQGSFIWKLRDELKAAIEVFDKPEVNTWLLTWNPSRWEWEDFDDIVKSTKSGVGVPIGWTCANTHTLVGDRIYMVKLGSSSTPNGIFATGYIISDNYKDESYDPTKESKARYVDIILTDVRDFNTEPVLEMDNLKEVFPSQNWSPQASGIAIKPYISAQLLNMWNELNSCKPCSENAENKSEEYSKYSKSDFLKDVYITESEYNKLFNLLKHKKNVILQGAPGVGKTFAAKRLAYSIMGEKDDNRVQCVQFHQSYSYEDFIEGFRPLENGGFELRKGVFKDFCQKASGDNENDYFFIIDEINRGNMSKVFGELLMLIEADKRGEEHSMNLVYSNEPFFVPKNLHIIGMMNTADRSLAMIDYALRRRFSFYPMKPAFESVGFKAHTEQVNCELFHKAVEAIKNLNTVIVGDKSLGKGFEIGHSYFCTDKPENITDEIVKNIIAFEIIPTIEEYWFDNETRLDTERQKLEALLGDNNGAV